MSTCLPVRYLPTYLHHQGMALEIRPEPMRAVDQDTGINASISWKWNGGMCLLPIQVFVCVCACIALQSPIDRHWMIGYGVVITLLLYAR